jgi:hypothetical protein
LADGVPFRVEQVRGFGNALNVEAAKAFVEAHQNAAFTIQHRAAEIRGLA